MYRLTAPSLDEAFRADVIAKLEQIASYPQSSPEVRPTSAGQRCADFPS